MALITLVEYARRIGKNPIVVRQKAARGGFVTAHKAGRDWWIDESEPFIDRRINSGKYIGARKTKKSRQTVKEEH